MVVDATPVFSKPYKTGASQALRNSDATAFRKDILAQFPHLTADNLAILFPSKSKILSSTIKENKYVLYFNQNQTDIPLFFKIGDGIHSGKLVPTVYALWAVPSLLPRIYTYLPLVEKITGAKAVPLYQAGVWLPELPDAFYLNPVPRSEKALLSPSSPISSEESASLWTSPFLDEQSFDFAFEKGQLRAVYALGHPHAIAVGISSIGLPEALKAGLDLASFGDYCPPWSISPWPGSSDASQFLSSPCQVGVNPKYTFPDISSLSAESFSREKIVSKDIFAHRPACSGPALTTLHCLNDELFHHAKTPTVPRVGFSVNAKGQIETIPVPSCEGVWKAIMTKVRGLWLGSLFLKGVQKDDPSRVIPEQAQVTITDEKTNNQPDDDVEIGKDDETPHRVDFANINVDDDNSKNTEIEDDNTESFSFSSSSSEPTVSAEEMSLRFEYALLFALKTGRISPDSLPLSDSTLFSQHMQFTAMAPSSSSYVESKLSTLPSSSISRVPVRLNIAKSTFKKFTKFLQHASACGYIETKRVRDSTIVVWVASADDNEDVASLLMDKADIKVVKTAEKAKKHGPVPVSNSPASHLVESEEEKKRKMHSGNESTAGSLFSSGQMTTQRGLIKAWRFKVPFAKFLASNCPPFHPLKKVRRVPKQDKVTKVREGCDEDNERGLEDRNDENYEEDDEIEDIPLYPVCADETELNTTLEDSEMIEYDEDDIRFVETTPREMFDFVSKMVLRDTLARSQVTSTKLARAAVNEYVRSRGLEVKVVENQPPLLKYDQLLFEVLKLNSQAYVPALVETKPHIGKKSLVNSPAVDFSNLTLCTMTDVGEAIQNQAVEVTSTVPHEIAQLWNYITYADRTSVNPETFVRTVDTFIQFVGTYRRTASSVKWNSASQHASVVIVSSTQINGKPVTLVAGTEKFGITPEQLAGDKAFKSRMACAVVAQPITTALRPLLYSKVASTSVLQIQGHLSDKVIDYLVTKANFDKKAFVKYSSGKLQK